METRKDFEGRTFVTTRHKWEPIYPIETMVQCRKCGRIEFKTAVRNGGLAKCSYEIKKGSVK